jgi:hypothetical protein
LRTNLPPMTPSMPAFTFGGFSQPTPPVHPHALFSPGIGPFSPQIGSPFFGPGGPQAMNPYQTVAPGMTASLYSPSFLDLTLTRDFAEKSRCSDRFQPYVPSFPSNSRRRPSVSPTATSLDATATAKRIPDQQ